MQSKLFVASMAAMAQNAVAVNTQAMSSASQETSMTPGESLASMYANCGVVVNNLVGEYATLGDTLKLTPSFTLSGIDSACPPMEATVWLEPPSDCATISGCPTEGLSTTIPADQLVNGAWSQDFTTDKISGEWFMHVTVTPTGFDCAIAMTDACSPVEIAAPCAAEVSGFKASNSINSAMGP